MQSPRRLPHSVSAAVLGWLVLAASAWASVAPVSFLFGLPPDSRNPFARDVWAEVTTPSGKALRLPAFFAGDGRFEVRARADEAGEYRLGNITENNGDQTAVLKAAVQGSDRVRIRETEDRPAIFSAPGSPARLVFAGGDTYTPVGANLAWAGADGHTVFPARLP